jgi:peptidyl-prolyl cis-trans isomerase C
MRNPFHYLAGLALALAGSAALAADPPPDTPLVKRDNIVVTVEDFNAGLATRIPKDRRDEFRGANDRILSVASALYLARTLAEKARAEGIDKDPELRKKLQIQEENLLADAWVERFEKSIKTPDFEARAKELYAADIQRYRIPERVKFRYIVVDTVGRTREEARRRADEARAKLVAKEPVSAVVRDYSNEPSVRANGGDWGPLGYSDVPAPISDVLQKLQPGEVSEVVEAGNTFHIVLLEERYRGKVVPFDEVKKDIIENEQFKYRRAIMDKMLGEITNSKDVTIYTDNIAKLKIEVDAAAIQRMHQEAAEKLARERVR